ncbi:hypothetical protein MKK88_21180 [Methylobacterium sp. E-005]|uniref:hypothetical protein n=1 Tax=Methylobacterium sp. E-005 TaxID=2836549 RepID=UPI001FB984AB|nr:hypothetical protein [Methylobacterium sp. E-005]MCJ2088474.1 hypothetical protein [Methylobacterium sp. E-005]
MSSEDTHTLRTRLAAVEAERDGLREGVQKMHRRCQSGEANLQGLVEHLRSGVDVWMKATRTAEAARDAALARAERSEKALEALVSYAEQLEALVYDPADTVDKDVIVKARAALTDTKLNPNKDA